MFVVYLKMLIFFKIIAVLKQFFDIVHKSKIKNIITFNQRFKLIISKFSLINSALKLEETLFHAKHVRLRKIFFIFNVLYDLII
jgi:hypothetical protein